MLLTPFHSYFPFALAFSPSLPRVGHQHTDEFKLFNDETYLIAENAAISPIYDNNPTFRITLFNRQNLELLDW